MEYLLKVSQARQALNPHVVLGAYGIFFLVIGAYYVLAWMTGGVEGWRPGTPDPIASAYPVDAAVVDRWPVQWWVFGALVTAPALVVYSTLRKGQILGGRDHPARAARADPRRYWKPAAVLIILLLLEAIAVFLTVLGLRDLAQRQIAGAWGAHPTGYASTLALIAAGPAAIWAGNALALRWAASGAVLHPALLHYAAPVNLLMVLGQVSDALMTSLGIDLFHYSEKHVLPSLLIRMVDSWNLPMPFGDYPTAMVMIPLKLLIVLLVVVAIDAGAQEDLKGRENLVGLVKLGILMVGLSPGVRDGVRLAMAT